MILLDNGDNKETKTVTTKRRMNQVSNQFDLGYTVYQKDHKWYCDYKNKVYKFESGFVQLER
jgi:hypothetical protein